MFGPAVNGDLRFRSTPPPLEYRIYIYIVCTYVLYVCLYYSPPLQTGSIIFLTFVFVQSVRSCLSLSECNFVTKHELSSRQSC